MFENRRGLCMFCSLLPQSIHFHGFIFPFSLIEVSSFLERQRSRHLPRLHSHLLETLKGKGLDVFFDKEKLQREDRISPALSQAIAASNLSLIILSKDYASSNSCLAELSDIMD
ncbi:hypothetical protein V6N13_122107 [Hibiscus sabdariffa]